jgi:surfeit locus 1 family protein
MSTPLEIKKRRSWRGLLIPALLAFAALVALGTWQIERKAWKEGLIAALNERLAAPTVALPLPRAWPTLDQASNEYRHVIFSAAFDYPEEALVLAAASAFRPDVSGPGIWVFTPARLADGGVVVVNRGFAPFKTPWKPDLKLDRRALGIVEITGVMRWPDARHWYTPNGAPDKNLWFVRDPATIAADKGWGSVSPFYVEQESPLPPPGTWPQPGKIVVNLPNNHLQYAVTWYGLALALVVVFAVWARSSRRAH